MREIVIEEFINLTEKIKGGRVREKGPADVIMKYRKRVDKDVLKEFLEERMGFSDTDYKDR
ncbi:MAG: hypothetical protein ACTSXJ_00385 [Candidatus Baldrarchaeia archaeon]